MLGIPHFWVPRLPKSLLFRYAWNRSSWHHHSLSLICFCRASINNNRGRRGVDRTFRHCAVDPGCPSTGAAEPSRDPRRCAEQLRGGRACEHCQAVALLHCAWLLGASCLGRLGLSSTVPLVYRIGALLRQISLQVDRTAFFHHLALFAKSSTQERLYLSLHSRTHRSRASSANHRITQRAAWVARLSAD